MIIKLSPQRCDDQLHLEKDGEALIINGDRVDFSSLKEGEIIPRNEIESKFVCGSVRRVEGVIHVGILLPHGKNASKERRFPEPIANPPDGVIDLPE